MTESNPELITALDLDQWSGTLAAQTTLPILVRRLILATTPVSEITMRAREGALLPGWDGIVRSDVTDAHVPLGTSGWELGTSKDPGDKAQSDIRSRTKDPLGLDPATTTFVAVTSRMWRDRDDWRDARRKERAVGRRPRLRRRRPRDVAGARAQRPPLDLRAARPGAARRQDARRVVGPVGQPDPCRPSSRVPARRSRPRGHRGPGRPRQPPRPITVVAPSREEALAIVCASLLGDGDEVDELRARAVIVSAPGAWDRLVDSDNALVLIPNFDDADIASALSKGHHVVIPLGRDARHAEGHIVVPLLDRAKAAEAILDEAAGITRDVANRYAAHAHRNLLSLRRTLAVNPRFAKPPWSEGEQGRRLAPLVLAGSWSDDVEGDRKAIETLTGRPYADVEGDLAAWAAQDDAPVTRTGQVWRIVSKEDAWDLVSALITKTTLTRFHDVAAAGPRGARSRARCPR